MRSEHLIKKDNKGHGHGGMNFFRLYNEMEDVDPKRYPSYSLLLTLDQSHRPSLLVVNSTATLRIGSFNLVNHVVLL